MYLCVPDHPPIPHVVVYPRLVPVTVVSYHMVLLSVSPWLLGIMHDAHDVPRLSSWKQAGPLSLPMRLCGRGGPAVGPAVLSLSWTEAHCAGKVRVCWGRP